MFGMQHRESGHEQRCVGGRHRHGRPRGFGGSRHGRHGHDGDDMMRTGRMLAQGDTYAYRYEGRRFDCGSKEGFLAATLHYARKAGYKV